MTKKMQKVVRSEDESINRYKANWLDFSFWDGRYASFKLTRETQNIKATLQRRPSDSIIDYCNGSKTTLPHYIEGESVKHIRNLTWIITILFCV